MKASGTTINASKNDGPAPPQAAAPALNPSRPLWQDLLIVAAFVLLITVPFLNQPFHMDDPGFIEYARARQDAPLEMQLHDYVFFGVRNETFFDTHPPLVSAYIATLMYVSGGESELLFHGAFLIFPLLAGISMYFLARKFTRHSLLGTLLLMGTPGIIVMSHTVMSDVPGISFWLATVALYVYGLERRSLGLMALCGITMTLGIFTSYQVLSVIPLLFVYAAVRRELSILALLPFMLPISSFASYMVWHTVATGSLPRFSYGEGAPMAWYSMVQKGTSVLVTLAAATIFFGILYRVLIVKVWDYYVYVVLLLPIAVSIISQYLRGFFSAPSAVLVILLMPLGMIFIYQIYAEGWERLRAERDRPRALAKTLLLLLWLTGVLFYVVVLMPYSSVRYLLPLFPPLVLLFVNLVETRFAGSEARVHNILLAAVVSTTALGLLVAAADLELARANRDVSQNEVRDLGGMLAAEGKHLWFAGEFGLRYYMEEGGYQELPLDKLPDEGDMIIQSPLGNWRAFSEELDHRLELYERIDYGGYIPVRVTSHRSNAGFYGSHWGILPFSLSTDEVEEYLVYRVLPPNDNEGWLTKKWESLISENGKQRI